MVALAQIATAIILLIVGVLRNAFDVAPIVALTRCANISALILLYFLAKVRFWG